VRWSWRERALAGIAESGRGRGRGGLLGREVGAGTHTYAGVKHAEVLALEQAGDAARVELST